MFEPQGPSIQPPETPQSRSAAASGLGARLRGDVGQAGTLPSNLGGGRPAFREAFGAPVRILGVLRGDRDGSPRWKTEDVSRSTIYRPLYVAGSLVVWCPVWGWAY